MYHILLLDSLHPSFAEQLPADSFQITDASQWDSEKILQEINRFDILALRSRMIIDKKLIEHATNLKCIARAGAGMENIDTAYAKSKNIVCLNSPEGNRTAVAEHAIAMLLCLLNNIIKANTEVKQGIWQRKPNWGIELNSLTVALIGFGNTGSTMAKTLSGFGCRILAYDPYITIDQSLFPYVQQTDMQTIYHEADVVSLHIPLNADTHYLVNHDYIRSFRNKLFLINTSRGKNVNTQHLAQAIIANELAGACLDVLEYEPTTFEQLDADLPAAFKILQEAENVILSPHIAGWTHQSNKKIAYYLGKKIFDLFKLNP